MIQESWSQHLDNVMDSGEDFPWDNEEPGLDDKDPRNPGNIYKDANNSLNKVKANAHPRTQKAGVGRGSGPAGGGGSARRPGGNRQGVSSGY